MAESGVYLIEFTHSYPLLQPTSRARKVSKMRQSHGSHLCKLSPHALTRDHEAKVLLPLRFRKATLHVKTLSTGDALYRSKMRAL